MPKMGNKIIGQVVLRKGQKDITLDMPYNLELEIQVEDENKKQKGVQHSLELEIKWYDDDSAPGPLELG
jgi:amphi-Trp domain-containing protein